jgi:predicted secreted hydrolase
MKNKFRKNNRILLLLFLLASGLIPAQEKKPVWKAAEPGYTFRFPQDYFNHEDYQTEWWYYTGNLKSADGRRFGFELTFFRQGVSRAPAGTKWFVNDLWMAHMALSDINGQRFYHEERLNRAGPALAGVDAQSGMVWNGNWQAHIAPRDEELRGLGDQFQFALNLTPAKPPVVQGQNGVSRKAQGEGHASHYFSLTRLITSGSIQLEGKTYKVDGNSWMDHEFFSGSMAADETGWDWLSVQLSDGTELMLYRLRHKNGTIDPFSSGSYVDASGKATFLSANDFSMSPDSISDSATLWTSAQTKAAYPIKWHVSIPQLKMAFDVTTPLKTQELTNNFGPSYWEGAVDATGSRDNAPLSGTGYLEMTGYSASGDPMIPR